MSALRRSSPLAVLPFPASSDRAMEHYSPSSLKDYLGCSLRFFFRRVLEIRKPASPALHVGKAVHAGIQAFHLARWRGGDDSVAATVDAYQNSFAQLEAEETVSYRDKAQRDSSRETGERVVQAYLESEVSAPVRSPMGVEVRLSDDYPSLDAPLIGIIDLVRENGTPVDFKTVSTTPNLELEAWLHELQLVAYQILIESATGKPVPAELVFLVKTKTPKVIRLELPPATQRQKARFWAMAEAAVDGIYHERWHPQPGQHCAWCQYRAECSNWQGSFIPPDEVEKRRAS